VISQVPDYEPWKSQFGNDPAALAALAANLKPTYVKNTFNISLQYDDENAKRAAAAISSVLAAYRQQYKTGTSAQISAKLQTLEDRQRRFDSDRRVAEKEINDIIEKYGSADLLPLVNAQQVTVEEVSKELRAHENNLRAAESAAAALKNGGNTLPIEELASVDTALAQMLNEIAANEVKLNTLAKTLGENHPKVKQGRLELQASKDYANTYADTLRKDIIAIIPDFTRPGGTIRVTAGNLRVLKARVEQLRQDLKKYEEIRNELRAAAGLVAKSQTAIKDATTELQQLNEQLERNRQILAMTGDLQIMQDGRFPSQVANKKIMFGLLGAIVGSSACIGVLLLMGLMDTRFRYSDDAAGNAMAGIPLLGILPNLPDRLSDPAQASIAAHCVHQIRTMLQLNAMRENSTVFSITSASSGDGKTSLSLALGLSFAASGSRTLLIDADLVGGGLTSRLGNNSPLGIVDALAGVNLDDCVQSTDVSDLAILPIGSAQAHHAGGFSPPAVRKLLAEARKRYEVIIIDTGPIMGSIEATPICASVDGVVLTVARGQSRPLVERAITHLQSIGAIVAGVVFNRAQHKDFEQSIGAISIRSAARSTANGSGHNARTPGDIGAVAKAVATSVVRNEN
jgi:capsular exopolysaccharide synthesis family protein